jgi:hypothetical protein
MTIRVPKRNFADKLLIFLGKKRGVLVPKDVHQKPRPYVFAQAKRESFWRALFRPRNAPLPNRVIDWEQFIKESRNEKE